MPTVTFITEAGESVEVQAEPGQTLMEAALAADVEGILAECGGGCSCATCHIILDDSWFEKLGGPNPLDCLLYTSDAADD